MAVSVLQLTELPALAVAELESRFTVLRAPDNPTELPVFLSAHGPAVRGIATTGRGRVDEALLDRLPNLEIIASYSAGLDCIDTAAADTRGILVTNTSLALAGDVADLAIGLVIFHSRKIPSAMEWVRHGHWSTASFPLGRSLSGKSLGIVGLGHIGSAVARRAEIFGMDVRYFGPRFKPEYPYVYCGDIFELARLSDFLVLTCPATPETKHLIDGHVLKALGANGYLVNVARGSVVDETALIRALAENAIAGAGLDVCDGEPLVAPELANDPKVTLVPHIGSATHEARAAMARSMIAALMLQFNISSEQPEEDPCP